LGAQLRRLLTGALLWATLVVLLLSVAGAVVMRNVFRRSLAGVFATANAISAGDLARRVPRSFTGDEFDSLAETINDMLDRINRLMDGVRHVSDAIAHDLRTPITRARMRLEDAARHAQGTDDLHAAIERAQLDLDGIVNTFQALLRITEIESGARRWAFERFDLVPVLQDLSEFYGAVAEDRGCVLTLRTPAQAVMVGDRALLQRAMANLIDNAVKFSPEDRAIDVALTGGAEWCVTVCDQGTGMSDADRARATERFFRAETARDTPGSGLGLSLVQAVAQLHGGSLTLADNAPGLRAEIRLPMSAAAGMDATDGFTPRAVLRGEPAGSISS
jgi:signal transduction histidine kinase